MSYIGNRDRPEFYAKLIRRGEFYLDLSCVKNWGRELKETIHESASRTRNMKAVETQKIHLAWVVQAENFLWDMRSR